LLRDLVPFGSPLLALIDQVRDRAAPVSKYRVDLGTPRNPGESIVDLHVAPVLERPGHVVIMLLERTIAYKMDCQLTHRGAARSVIALAAMLAHEIKKLAQNGFAIHIRLVQDYDPSLPPVLANRSIGSSVPRSREECRGSDRRGSRPRRNTINDRAPPRRAVVDTGSVSLPLEFCVKDNGPGGPEDLMPHLFDPFVTTKPSRSGLGLALVARSSAIIEASSSASRKPGIRFFAS
jgi:nitrogen-specific signal transduction histidine kinase